MASNSNADSDLDPLWQNLDWYVRSTLCMR